MTALQGRWPWRGDRRRMGQSQEASVINAGASFGLKNSIGASEKQSPEHRF